MRFTERQPDLRRIEQQRVRDQQLLTRVAGGVNDDKTKAAQQRQRSAMQAAQLGRLGNAVKVKTGRSRDQHGEPNAFGVIYADNGDKSRAGQALLAYSEGTTIAPIRGAWLWYQTDKLARTSRIPGAGRAGRLTPERYAAMGSPLGPLQFARITPRFAKLYVEVADINVKTGRAVAAGRRRSRTRVRTERVTLFFGIKNTRRAQRYDAARIVAQAHGEIPPEIARQMRSAFAGR